MLNLLRRLSGARPRGRWDLSRPLMKWSRGDCWTIGNAVEGTLILGATGSGKTSSSGRALALSFLDAGFGGLVLTAKPDERALWEDYCMETGRYRDLLIFGPDQPLRFNFIDHEVKRKGRGAGLTENIVALLNTVLEVAERGATQGGGRESDDYWRRSCRQLSRNLVFQLLLAKGSVSVPDLYRLVVSAPTSPEQLGSEEWRANSMCFRYLTEADKRVKSPREQHDFGIVADYFLKEFPGLSDKTRSVIVSTFTSMIDVLNRGLLRELLCTDTNVTPEVIEDGKIILIDLPVKEFGEVGQIAQVLWKHAFQRSIERRDVQANPRPVFLFSDEAQFFLTSHDMQFQTTCRASRVATVLLSQNVSNVYAALGGNEKGRVEADSLFANLNTKIFHANGDPVTNQWAATLIGRTRQMMASGNSSFAADHPFGANGNGHTSAGYSETYEFEVQPSAFTSLRTGGPANKRKVDAIVFQNGRKFKSTGRTWLPVTFRQGP